MSHYVMIILDSFKKQHNYFRICHLIYKKMPFMSIVEGNQERHSKILHEKMMC